MTVWVGVDPGMETGIVARDGRTLIGWRVIDAKDVEPGAARPGRPTMELIEATVRALGGVDTRVAVEDTVPPNSHHDGRLSIRQVEPLLRTAGVVGWLLRAFPDAVLVRPAGNGHDPLAAYLAACPDLVSQREHANAIRKGTLMAKAPQHSQLRHARSAWDIAGVAARQDRIDRAITRTSPARPATRKASR
jgi:hypothetical protein